MPSSTPQQQQPEKGSGLSAWELVAATRRHPRYAPNYTLTSYEDGWYRIRRRVLGADGKGAALASGEDSEDTCSSGEESESESESEGEEGQALGGGGSSSDDGSDSSDDDSDDSDDSSEDESGDSDDESSDEEEEGGAKQPGSKQGRGQKKARGAKMSRPRLLALDCEMCETEGEKAALLGVCVVDDTGKVLLKVGRASSTAIKATSLLCGLPALGE